MALTTVDSILSLAAKRPPQKLHIKALGDDVYILDPTADTRDELDLWIERARGNHVGMRGVIAALLLCDADGKRLFKLDDAPRLGQMSPAVLQPIFDLGTKALAVSDREQKELEGNSDASR
jgi:hypothetical protein